MTVELNETELTALLESTHGEVGRYIDGLTTDVLVVARSLCPKGKTGQLAAGLRAEVTLGFFGAGPTGRVFSDSPILVYVERGTGLYGPRHHVIDVGKPMGPINLPYPRFLRRSRGMHAQPFMVRSLELGQPHPVRVIGWGDLA